MKNEFHYTRSLVEASFDPLVTIGIEGKITDMNEVFLNIIGITHEKLTGIDVVDCFTEPQKAYEVCQEVFTKGTVVASPLALRHKDGKPIDVLFNGSVYKNDKGNALGVVIVLREITKKKVEDKFQELLAAIYQKYGYDFRQYSEAHIKRRIMNRMTMSGIEDIAQMQYKVLNDETFASKLLQDLSITVTEMFRDPGFYRSLRENVIPILKTYPFVKIWHAGCSTGEEAYSMAIIMQEEGLYDRTTIYATDFNQLALNQAKEGIFSNKMMKEYTTNYQLSGGTESFSRYYTSGYDSVIINQSLKKNIVWANHNLVTDNVFAEVHLILCRNVLIYFDKYLQNKVQNIFYTSLINGGILCLGSKEGLRFTGFHEKYIALDTNQQIFKKKY